MRAQVRVEAAENEKRVGVGEERAEHERGGQAGRAPRGHERESTADEDVRDGIDDVYPLSEASQYR